MYTQDRINHLKELVKACKTWDEAQQRLVKELSIHRDNVTRLNRRYSIWMSSNEGQRRKEMSEPLDVSVETESAQTIDEVVAMCGVDLDKWESKGFSVRRSKTGFGWNARFGRKEQPLDTAKLVEALAKEAAKHAPRKWAVEKRASKEADCLYVLNIQDLHLSKLAWSRETGSADWDIRIAEETYREAVTDLMFKVPLNRVEEVLVIIGSDMLQVDNDQSTTTAGTYVDSDSRLAKTFEVAAKMLTDTIEQLAQHARVRAVVVQGNHDHTVSLLLGHYVAAWFRSHPRVTVDHSPTSRKYVGYGKTLIGFDHGSDTKLDQLPLLMMRENQETISQYLYMEMLTGDKHHESVKEFKGVKVRIAPALCPPDKWHASHGFSSSMRQSQGLLYQCDNGLEAIYYSTPLKA